MLRIVAISAASRRACRCLAAASRSIQTGSESFDREGHVILTEQGQGDIVERVREAATLTDLQAGAAPARGPQDGQTAWGLDPNELPRPPWCSTASLAAG